MQKGEAPVERFPFLFLWVVRLTTQKTKQPELARDEHTGAARNTRGTRTRTRCKGRTHAEEVRVQTEVAMPEIVGAMVEKAKAGSLTHTKWLLSVVDKIPKKHDEEHARLSLAALLMEQLKEAL